MIERLNLFVLIIDSASIFFLGKQMKTAELEIALIC
jgi:hypothetical protein